MKFKFFKVILSTVFSLVIIASNAQTRKTTACGYIIPPKSVKTNFASVYEARDIVNQMLQTINWKENFRLQERNGIQNAYATIMNNVRWIVYDNEFLENIDSYSKTKWASISILAHEMGHHYYDHVVSQTGSTIPKEIEADAFSGFLMAKMGATKEQSIAAITTIASDRASSTHPAKKDRVNAISAGWDKAGVASNTGTVPPVVNNPQPAPTRPPTGTVNNPGNTQPLPPNYPQQTDPTKDPSWIALSMQSNKDETVYLSDDGKTYQQAAIKAGQPFVFKFEVYNYGWLRLKYYNGYRSYKLMHGKDYAILWNRRTGNWTVVEIKD